MPYAHGAPFAGVVVTPMLNVRPEARTIDPGGVWVRRSAASPYCRAL
jgi:hypothetical protein